MPEAVHFRRKELLELLRQDIVASIHDLSSQLDVSEPTIRRDLDVLQNEGVIERIHGGARLKQPVKQEMAKRELPFYIRLEANIEEKKAIARAALQFLEPDQVIMLDSSTTGLLFGQAIPDDISSTIITHSAYLPVELVNKPNLQIISTGGILHSNSLCYLGLQAEDTINQFHVHRAFFGTQGIAVQAGCTDSQLLEVNLKRKMAQKAPKLIILADHSKLGNVSLSSFAPLSRVRTLVTDEKADPNIVKTFRAEGIEVVIASLDSDKSVNS